MNSLTDNGPSSHRCCRPSGRGRAGPTKTIGPFSMGLCGSWPPASLGATCRSGMALGPRCTVASAAGASRACGTACSPPSGPTPTPRASWIGRSTSSMARLSGRTSMRPGQRGGPGRGSARAQPGRLLDEGPPPRGGPRQAADAGPDARPAARSDGLRATPGTGGRAAPGARPAPAAARSRRGRQRLHGAHPSSVLSAPGDSAHHPASVHGAPPRAVQSRGVPLAQPSGAADQPLQAVPQPGHSLRQAGRQLPHALGHRSYSAVVAEVGFAYRP
jgi:hypothetical protein